MSNKTILITGATKRIGKKIAQYFYQPGWNIAIHYYQSEEEIPSLKQEFTSQNQRIAFFKANLRNEEECKNLLNNVIHEFGRLDCLVNNASIFIDDNIHSSTKEIWNLHMETNLRAPFFLSQCFFKSGQTGNIVNIIDECVTRIKQNYLSYNLSKHALWAVTKMLALSLAPTIKVNAIGPGLVLPSNYQTIEQFTDSCKLLPIKKSISPQEIAQAIYFLVTMQDSMTGQILLLDNGEHLAKA